MLRQEPDYRHHESGRTEPTLQRVTLVKRLLHRMECSAVAREALNGRHVVALGLHREHEARPHRRSVQQYRAAPANTVLAADMGSGQAQLVAQVVGEQPPRIGRSGSIDAVDPHAAKARSVSTRTR